MSGGDGFLTRWSRRKLGAEPDAPPPEPAAELGTTAPELASAAPAETLSDEELALLPPIEELTPDSDITAFLRKGVPEVLKKAALRRIWALDPTIRDYVGDARDYAWDWNTPGDVPGGGPLLPGDDMAERIERMFSRAAEPSESQPGTPDPTIAAVEPPATVQAAEVTQDSDSHGGEEAERSEGSAAGSAVLLPDDAGPNVPLQELAPPQPTAVEPPLRRHGAALPKFDLF
jgi:hypothetical protein